MFAVAFFVASMLSCEELYDPESVNVYAQLNLIAASSGRHREHAAFLFRRKDGRVGVIRWQPGVRTEAVYYGSVPAGCFAIAHTHPMEARQPSPGDIATAKQIGLPVVVISPYAITVATPQGSTQQLLGADWVRIAQKGR